MLKKYNPTSSTALIYYVGANLIALIPSVVIGVLIAKIAVTSWQYILLEVITFGVIFYLSLRWSASNINKGYIVTSTRGIVKWSIGYLLFFNLLFSGLLFTQIGYISVSFVGSLINILLGVIMLYLLTPKWVHTSDEEEKEKAKVEALSNPQPSFIRHALRTAGLIIGGFILLLTVPSISYFILTSEASLSGRNSLILIIVYELVIIWLARWLVFKRNKKT